jgi:acylglycerol lipase
MNSQTAHSEGTIPGALGGRTYWQSWRPPAPVAVVVLVHGVAEHSSRYAHVAARLNDAGYAVYGLDHRGHGRSSGMKGNLGRFAGAVADLHAVRRLAEADVPDRPVFVLGHSLGGLIALDYVTTTGAEGLAGVALSGTAIDPSIGTRLQRRLAPALSALLPGLGVTALDPAWISKDPAVVSAYRADPLVYSGKVRARTGAETLRAITRVSRALAELRLPVLVMHGTEDRLASPDGARELVRSIGSSDTTLRLYGGCHHEIFNEPEREQVFADLVEWLDAHR